jgi:hypothetical protein
MNKNSSINEVQSTYPQANVKAQRQDCCKNLAETQKMCAESTFLKYRSEKIHITDAVLPNTPTAYKVVPL